MLMRDITRGCRVISPETGEVVGEVTSGVAYFDFVEPPGFSYTYTLYVKGQLGEKMWSGAYMYGPVVASSDTEVPFVVPGSPSGLPLAGPPRYFDVFGREIETVPDFRFIPRPFANDPEVSDGEVF